MPCHTPFWHVSVAGSGKQLIALEVIENVCKQKKSGLPPSVPENKVLNQHRPCPSLCWREYAWRKSAYTLFARECLIEACTREPVQLSVSALLSRFWVHLPPSLAQKWHDHGQSSTISLNSWRHFSCDSPSQSASGSSSHFFKLYTEKIKPI